MKKIVIVSVLVSVVLMGIIYSYVGDIIGDDMVNILTLLSAVLILILTVGVGLKYVNQMKNDKASGKLADENWDGIGEYKNELPIGWAVSFLGTIIFFIWYLLVGYPLWSYSQIGEYNEEVKAYNTKFEEKHKNISDDELQAMGESVFLVNCAPCHGVEGDGMDGKAADLTRRLDASTVEYTIIHGSAHKLENEYMTMPAGLLQDPTEIKTVSNYIANGFIGNKGAEIFANNCASCHGSEGAGIPGVGINLRSFTPNLVRNVLENGKKGAIGTMPTFKIEELRLSGTQQKAVGTYITNLGEGF